ncbi:hypothetical protein N2152v2_004540 [Parachlorella kessleri]
MEAYLVTAPGDGVSPSLLLTLGQRLKGQYVFNVPEGFARLVLEHKVRPTANLRAAFATDLQSLAGFGGLAMRLRNEGHGQVQVLGPPGTQTMVTSLRHFIHWKHPAVLVSDLSEWETPVCYEDEHIAVAALWKPPLVPELWHAPGWLMEPSSQQQSGQNGSSKDDHKSNHSSSSSSSSGSEDGSSSGSEGMGTPTPETHPECGSMEAGLFSKVPGPMDGQQAQHEPSQDSESGVQQAAQSAGAAQGGGQARSSMFDELDQIFMRGAGLASGGSRPAAGHLSSTRLSVLERLRAGQVQPLDLARHYSTAAAAAAGRGVAACQSLGAAQGSASCTAGHVGQAAGNSASTTARLAIAAAAAGPAWRRPSTSPGAAAAASQQGLGSQGTPLAAGAAGTPGNTGKVFVVGGKLYRELLVGQGVSVWAHDKLSSRASQPPPQQKQPKRSSGAAPPPTAIPAPPSHGSSPAGHPPKAAPRMQGFLCHIKATDQLLLVGNLHSRAAAKLLVEHPAVERLRQQGARVLGSVLLVGEAGLSKGGAFRRLVGGLPGDHIVLEHPGSGLQEIGHLAAASTTAKLHLVAPSLFPLPASLADAVAAPAAVEQRATTGPGSGSPAQPQTGPSGPEEGLLEGSNSAPAAPARPQAGGTAEQQGQQLAVNEAAAAAATTEEEGKAIHGCSEGPGSRERQVVQGEANGLPARAEQPGKLAGTLAKGQRRPQWRQRQQAEQQQRGGSSVHFVRHLTHAVWAPPPSPAAAAGASAAAADSGAAPAAMSGCQGLAGKQPVSLLRLESGEAFTPQAAAGDKSEARPSGADPAAVWRELRASKAELPSRLAALAGVLERLGSLPSGPHAAPLANRVQPPPVPAAASPTVPAGGLAAGVGSVAQQGAACRQPPSQQLWGAGITWQPGGVPQQPSGMPGTTGVVHYQPLPVTQRPHTLPQHHQQPVVYLPPGCVGLATRPSALNPPPPPAPPGMMWVLQPAPPPWPPQQGYPAAPAVPSQAQFLHEEQQAPATIAPQPGPHPQPPRRAAGSVVQTAIGAPAAPPPRPPLLAGPSNTAGEVQSMESAGVASVLGKRPSAAPHASNKRAAAELKARLKGEEGPSQEAGPAGRLHNGTVAGAQPGAAVDQPAAAAAAATDTAGSLDEAATLRASGETMQQGPVGRQQQAQQPPAWAAGAPHCLQALAAAGDGTQVVFLGTGSAEPSKYRGASAVHLRLDCGQGILLDCGEGCLGQMQRLYGHRGAMRQVAALGCVWVSHRHADHMLGLLGVLAAYPPHLPPLLVVGPRSALDWLAEAAPRLRLRYAFAHCQELNSPAHWARQQLAARLGLVQLEAVAVRHCSDAYGVVMGHRDGWRVVYSGDTQPSERLIQAGRGCTLLIHEATFEPCLADQAARKRHSTTAEALAVAQAMGAYRTILTHFSQRYPKFPEGLPAEGPAAATTAIAFDGMSVPLAALPLLPQLRPAVEYVLASEGPGEEVEEQ